MNRTRMLTVLIILAALVVTLTGAFMTRGVMTYLPFLQAKKGDWTGAYVPLGIADQRPRQTAAALAALAQSAEERRRDPLHRRRPGHRVGPGGSLNHPVHHSCGQIDRTL